MKNLFLLRGLPGAGKSTLANQLSEDHFEADMYFTNESGQYLYNPNYIKQAHQWCQNQVLECMESHKNKSSHSICVSNTFTQEWEMEHYFELAKTYGYRVFTLIVESRHQSGNIHNVPDEIIEKMKKRFSIFL